jgi:hypothetical protein
MLRQLGVGVADDTSKQCVDVDRGDVINGPLGQSTMRADTPSECKDDKNTATKALSQDNDFYGTKRAYLPED